MELEDFPERHSNPEEIKAHCEAISAVYEGPARTLEEDNALRVKMVGLIVAMAERAGRYDIIVAVEGRRDFLSTQEPIVILHSTAGEGTQEALQLDIPLDQLKGKELVSERLKWAVGKVLEVRGIV